LLSKMELFCKKWILPWGVLFWGPGGPARLPELSQTFPLKSSSKPENPDFKGFMVPAKDTQM